ncbi:MAG: VOC family protein [Hyphomicrobiales bacterium]|nr:VOC family protein [Hyphomicrobiales bacterium]
MIDHLSIPVSDMDKARGFYDAALAALGYQRLREQDEAGYIASGYGMPGGHEPPFWLGAASPPAPAGAPPEGQHIAFQAPNRAAVDAFHAAAMAAGGRDNGSPGVRAHYHANYYAAFVIDADGHHLEAVTHAPE